MSVYEINKKEVITKLFENWQETIIWSCLQGYMGQAYAEDLINPESAQILVGDFCFLAGKANKELILNVPKERKSNFVIMIPQNKEWEQMIEFTYQENAKRVTRYAIKKEHNIFQKERLQEIVNGLQEPYHLQMIDEKIFKEAKSYPWSIDLCSQFANYEEYKNHGLGAAITKNGELVSGASSYTYYREGIEIEIDTREDERRKGLALVCGAKLLHACLEKGLYPSWDAQNRGSVALAEKLGYHFDKEYPAYEVYTFGII